jgi:hypothetical protein
MRVIGSGIFIRRGENGVPLGAEFLEGLGIDEFLQLGLEGLFWGFFVPFNNFDGIPCDIKSDNF